MASYSLPMPSARFLPSPPSFALRFGSILAVIRLIIDASTSGYASASQVHLLTPPPTPVPSPAPALSPISSRSQARPLPCSLCSSYLPPPPPGSISDSALRLHLHPRLHIPCSLSLFARSATSSSAPPVSAFVPSSALWLRLLIHLLPPDPSSTVSSCLRFLIHLPAPSPPRLLHPRPLLDRSTLLRYGTSVDAQIAACLAPNLPASAPPASFPSGSTPSPTFAPSSLPPLPSTTRSPPTSAHETVSTSFAESSGMTAAEEAVAVEEEAVAAVMAVAATAMVAMTVVTVAVAATKTFASSSPSSSTRKLIMNKTLLLKSPTVL